MAKTSIKAAVRDAVRADAKLRKQPMQVMDGAGIFAATQDSFQNFAHKLGIGADNPLSTASYGLNPITRLRTQLEWIHRGSWLGGVAIDIVADDMTRAGIDILSEMEPDDIETLHNAANTLGIWKKTNETIKWGRLYGGAAAVLLIDGQDASTPLRMESVGRDQFKGLLVLDRWMLDPSLEDLVTDLGPDLGLPKYYRVQSNAPALRNKVVHYSRLAFRIVGIELPYQQRMVENLWGESVIERLYDRMIAYDSASTGAAQLVYKSYLRTLSIKGMREVVSMGGPALDGLLKYTNLMRQYQGQEGVTLIDLDDKFEAQVHGAFSGLSDALMQFAQQLSGALQIPLTRLFGQSPAGLNATGDNDMRNYYDHIKQRQENDLRVGMMRTYQCLAQSEGIEVPEQKKAKAKKTADAKAAKPKQPTLQIEFRSLWQLTDVDKASIAKSNTETVTQAHSEGLISDQVALQELRQASRITGVFSNITSDLIDAADEEVQDPMEGMQVDPATGLPLPPSDGSAPGQPGQENDDGLEDQPKQVVKGKERRKALQRPASVGGEAD